MPRPSSPYAYPVFEWNMEKPKRPKSPKSPIEAWSKVEIAKPAETKVVVPGDKTRPKFLTKVLFFCQEELKLLGAANSQVGDSRRLQVFKQAFDLFINEFKQYKAILSVIKREYDSVILLQREELDRVETYKSQLAISEFKTNQQVEQVRRESRHLVTDLTAEKMRLENELKQEKMDNQELKSKLEYLIEQSRHLQNNASPDSIKLKQLSQQYDEFEKMATEQISEKQELLARSYHTIEKYLSTAKNEVAVLKDEVAELLKQLHARPTEQSFNKQTETIIELEKKIHDLEVVKSPKPTTTQIKSQKLNWKYIEIQFSKKQEDIWQGLKSSSAEDVIIGLVKKIISLHGLVSRQLGDEKASNVIKETLVDKMDQEVQVNLEIACEKPPIEEQDPLYFIGLGTGSNIPKFLRKKGKILNKKLAISDCQALVKTIWEAKLANDKSKSRVEALDEFLYIYLKKRFGSQAIIADWGYNILNACKKYSADSVDCFVFANMLQGNLDQSFYGDLDSHVKHFYKLLQTQDKNENDGVEKGSLPKNSILGVIKREFPLKTTGEIDQLAGALLDDTSGSIEWPFLFKGVENTFVDIFKSQELLNHNNIVNSIENSIHALDNNEISFNQAREILDSVYTNISVQVLDYMTRRLFQESNTIMDKTEFLAKFRRFFRPRSFNN